jgi:[ribosomal protein S5]-alanine N-acetyltransferase
MRSLSSIERVQTPRLICERLRMEHVPEVSRLLRDPLVAQTLWPGAEAPTEQQVIDSTADKERHWSRYGFGMWLIRDRATGEMVGRGGLQWTYVASLNEVEAGWAIIPERWGQGLATELAQAAIEVAFDALELHEIVAFALPENVASRRVMEKTGFMFDGEIVHGGLEHVLYCRRADAASVPAHEAPAHG